MKKAFENGLIIVHTDNRTQLALPFADAGIKAGFPSPAQDYIESAIDLNKELIQHPSSTFYGRVKGDSMQDAGLYDGDIVVIDRSLEPTTGDKVVCFLDGEFTIKFIEKSNDCLWLVPANPNYPKIRVTPENQFMVWGIVTYSITRHRSR